MLVKWILPFSLYLTSCSSISMLEKKVEIEQQKTITESKDLDSSKSLDKPPLANGHGLVEKMTALLVSDAHADDMKLQYSPKLFSFWINYYTKRERSRYMRHLENADRYNHLVKGILAEHGLPEDLFYVGLIESGYNTAIRSHADAVGPWQFIKGTADRYGLKVNSRVDERRNIHKATHAAANYFKDLYNIFGSWELALCAYNAGEYRIINAIRKGNTRDYRELVRKKLIPKETIYYVPKIAAAKVLFEKREEYGLGPKKRRGLHFESSKIVHTRGNHSISSLASTLEVPRDILKDLNPDWHGGRMNISSSYRIVVPKRKAHLLASETKGKKSVRARVRKMYLGQKIHVVQRGENLSLIAQRNRTAVETIKEWNALKTNTIHVGQKIVVSKSTHKIYIVKRGDNLFNIAKRFNTSIKEIVKRNGLASTTIFNGQKIRIPSS